jgi:hypothetical protein
MLVIAHRRLAGVEARSIVDTFVRTLLAAAAMGGAVLAFTHSAQMLSPLLAAAGGGLLGIIVYIGAGLLLGVEELRLVGRRLESRRERREERREKREMREIEKERGEKKNEKKDISEERKAIEEGERRE